MGRAFNDNLGERIRGLRDYCRQRMSGKRQIAIAALAFGSFAAGYSVSFLKFDMREPDEAYANYMRQCVFLGDKELPCAEDWRLMDSQEKIFLQRSWTTSNKAIRAKETQRRRSRQSRV